MEQPVLMDLIALDIDYWAMLNDIMTERLLSVYHTHASLHMSVC